MSAKPAQRVLIIGAGSAGLLIAQVLRKAGIPATVFEQDASPTSRPRDWNFKCLPAELHALVQSTQTDPTFEASRDETFNIYNGKTGEVITKIPTPYSMRIRRRPWLEMLKTGIDLRYGKKMSSISLAGEKVTAAFADRTSETGTLFIGAEGAHSPTRDELPQPITLELAKFHPRHITTFGPSGMFVWIGIHDRTPTSTTYMIFISWNSPEETGLQEKGSEAVLTDLKSRAAKYLTFPFREAIQTVPEGTRAWEQKALTPNILAHKTLGQPQQQNNTSRRRGTCHDFPSSPPFLPPAPTTNNLSQAIPLYEQELQTRGLAAVQVNLENTLCIHNWETLVQSPINKMGLVSRDAEVGVEDDKVLDKRDGKVEKNGKEEGEHFDD
ncbi:hypothetical protein QBC43DRAFT_299370 [Cladorrhinum sp. PSN259]|nr:hypothetical protein QBC43DRAFT_299370 [Cladorrhinum sp. PSN259]